jgi:hypothetical protein
MKLSLVVVFCAVFVASQAYAAEKIQLKTEKDKLSYTKGVNMGNSFKRQAVEVDQKYFEGRRGRLIRSRDFDDQGNGRDRGEFPESTSSQEVGREKKLSEKNKRGEAFLAANAKRKA